MTEIDAPGTGIDAAGTEPAATEPTGTEPAGAEPTATEPTGTEPSGAGREAGGRSGILLAAVGGVALAGIGGTIAFGIMWAHDRSQASDQAAARAVASSFLHDLTTFTPKTLNSDFAAMQAMATGQFANQARQYFSSNIRGQLANAQATTQGTVQHLYVQSYSGSAASYYGDVTQTFRNNLSPAVHSDELRVVVTLSKVGGQWKVSQVTTIDSGGSSGAATPGTGGSTGAPAPTTPGG